MILGIVTIRFRAVARVAVAIVGVDVRVRRPSPGRPPEAPAVPERPPELDVGPAQEHQEALGTR